MDKENMAYIHSEYYSALERKKILSLVTTCEIREISQAQKNKYHITSLTRNLKKSCTNRNRVGAGGVAQVVECLPNKHSSTPSTTKKKKKK
jgi:hypothetical protein